MLAVGMMVLVVAVMSIAPRFERGRRLLHWLSKTYVVCNPLGAAMFGICLGTWLAVGYRIGWRDALVASIICTVFAVDDWVRRCRKTRGCVAPDADTIRETDRGAGHDEANRNRPDFQ